ncbi:MAG: SH3 domain-containing protein [Actinophytocola sp.]|uniref:SH3 domain-containing protein n=1 Tax=Actinophytocola sp. TaxID=1872138 RepID=UPI003C711D04
MRKTLVMTAVAASVLSGITLAAPASAVPKAPPSEVGAMHASCGTIGPNRDNRVDADAPSGGAANQRSGTSTNCTILGVLQPTDDALYFCWTEGNDGYTWTYLRNQRTGVRGWVRDNLLDGYGSDDYCGF